MSSIVLITETLFSIERFWIKICWRSLDESCSDGTIVVGVNFREELSGFDRLESGLFSIIFDLINLIAIEIISLMSFHSKIASK